MAPAPLSCAELLFSGAKISQRPINKGTLERAHSQEHQSGTACTLFISSLCSSDDKVGPTWRDCYSGGDVEQGLAHQGAD